MRRITPILCSILLTVAPLCVSADTAVPFLPPPPEMPFDDIDPAMAQTEVAERVASFLQRLDAQWGTPQETIRGLVSGPPERDDRSALVYARTLFDHGVMEGYDFREGALVRGQYVFLQRPVNGLNEFIEYYGAVKLALAARYGTPLEDRTIWENDLYQPLPDYWGIAVQIGHLRYAATWKTAEGTLTIELTGHHHSRLTIEYRSKAFVEHQQTASRSSLPASS